MDAYLFSALEQVREITEEWIKDYNEDRPHTANEKLPAVQNWQHPKPAGMSPIRVSNRRGKLQMLAIPFHFVTMWCVVLILTLIYLSLDVAFAFGGDGFIKLLEYHAHNAGVSKDWKIGSFLEQLFQNIALANANSDLEYLKLNQARTFLLNSTFLLFALYKLVSSHHEISITNRFQVITIWGVFILLAFESYFISSLLAGHTTFYWALSLAFALSSRSYVWVTCSVGLLLLVNPYLVTIYAIFLYLLNSHYAGRLLIFSGIMLSIIIISNLVVIFPSSLEALYPSLTDRSKTAVGLLPHHFVLPSPVSFFGFNSGYVEFVNRFTPLSNVPEMIFSLPLLTIIILPFILKNLRPQFSRMLLRIPALYITLVMPPLTRVFGEPLYFPSYWFSVLLSDFRMMNRAGVGLGVSATLLVLFYILGTRAKTNKILLIMLCFVSVTLIFPVAAPRIDGPFDTAHFTSPERCLRVSSWNDVYTQINDASTRKNANLCSISDGPEREWANCRGKLDFSTRLLVCEP